MPFLDGKFSVGHLSVGDFSFSNFSFGYGRLRSDLKDYIGV